MKDESSNIPSTAMEEGQFSLPFSDESIRTNQAGARRLARIACEMAVLHSSPIESDKQCATRLATFICGYIAYQCDNSEEQMSLFDDFLKQVYGWLNRGCSEYEASHHWNVFSENEAGSDEIVKADYLGNI
ncbi:MAG: hypothetical protein ABFS43_11580 [Thermodesulfobacteriota bacterium]